MRSARNRYETKPGRLARGLLALALLATLPVTAPSAQSAEATYDQAIARRYPEQVVIAIAKDRKGKYNPITLGWTMLASHEPPMMAIAVGKTRYSLQAIRHCREFVVSMASSTCS